MQKEKEKKIMTKKKQKVDKSVLITTIIGLVILEIAAMQYGINGTMRTIIFSIIALICGISIPTEKVIKLSKD